LYILIGISSALSVSPGRIIGIGNVT